MPQLLARMGYVLRPLGWVAEERRRREALAVLEANAAALQQRLLKADRAAGDLRHQLKSAHASGASRLAALKDKLLTARAGHAAAEAALAAAMEQNRRLEAALRSERARAADEQARLRGELELASRRLDRLRDERDELSALAAALTDEAVALQPPPARPELGHVRGGKADGSESRGSDARALFEQGRRYQTQGAIRLAVAAYARVGPRISDFLAQTRADGVEVRGPDFLIIGAPRAGTTWLKKGLSHHPQLFILARELAYFLATPHVPPEAYVANWTGLERRFLTPGGKPSVAAAPEPRFFGEKSPQYLAMPDAYIDLCAALFPNVRLICAVREPVSRAWSDIRHQGLAPSAGDLQYLRSRPPWASLDAVVEAGRYEKHLRRWARRFPPEQILLVDFDRLAREPEAVYHEVVRHIGAQTGPLPPDLGRVGAAETMDAPGPLLDHLHAAYLGASHDVADLRRAMSEAAAETLLPQGGRVSLAGAGGRR